MTSEIITTTSDCEIVSSRTVNAPRDLVFKAWADPDHLKNWWGPKDLQILLMNLILDQVVNGVLPCMALTKVTILMNVSL